jgi:hypothetical protein
MKVSNALLSITDIDLSRVASALPAMKDIKALTVSVTPTALVLSGRYHALLFWTPFSTEWGVVGYGGVIEAQLNVVKVNGIPTPGNMIENQIMTQIKDALEGMSYFSVNKDVITFDVVWAAKQAGITLDIKIKGVRLQAGEIVLEC